MKRRDVLAVLTFSLALTTLVGCPEPGGDLADPPGTAPELAGYWQMQGDTAWVGCGYVDDTGDFVSLSDNNFVRTQLGVNTLEFDGVWKPSSFNGIPIEFAATSEVTKTGDHVRLEAVITVRSFGVVLGYYNVISEGTLTADTITGTTTEFTNLPGMAFDAPVTVDGVLVRGACD